MPKKLHYELDSGIVSYILEALNRVQIAGIQSAKDLLTVTELLQHPTNEAEIEQEQLETLKAKYETKKKDK